MIGDLFWKTWKILTFLSTKEHAISFRLANVSSPSTLIWSLVKPICIWKLRDFFPLFVSSIFKWKGLTHECWLSPHQNVILLIGDFRVLGEIGSVKIIRSNSVWIQSQTYRNKSNSVVFFYSFKRQCINRIIFLQRKMKRAPVYHVIILS